MAQPQVSSIRPMKAPHFKLNPKPHDKGKVVTVDRLAAWIKEDGYIITEPKIDGMRVLSLEMATSRSGLAWTNMYMQAWNHDHNNEVWGWDQEILPGLVNPDEIDPEIFRRAMSGVRSTDGASQLTTFVFDNCCPTWAKYHFKDRRKGLEEDFEGKPKIFHPTGATNYIVQAHLIQQVICTSVDEVLEAHSQNNIKKMEGTMLRRWRGRYKNGKSTPVEGFLTKIKDEEDVEGLVIGYEPEYANNNEAVQSALGYTQRSAHKANLVAKERLGSLRVLLLPEKKVEFSVGIFIGLTNEDLEELWRQRDTLPLVGKIVKMKVQEFTGGYDKPRTPRVWCWRDPLDMDEEQLGMEQPGEANPLCLPKR